tara:strand:+ start:482 stop:733 length:252 start_codon:yes stop_codon:yes gene_type:complete
MAKITRRNPDESTPQWRYINQQEKLKKLQEERIIKNKLKEQEQKDFNYNITDEEMKNVWVNPEFSDMLEQLKIKRLKKQQQDD